MTGFENPWKAFYNSVNPHEIIRHMVSRASIFLGYSHKTLDDKEIIAMAKLEANNCFNALDTPDIRRVLSNYENQNTGEGIADEIIKMVGPYGVKQDVNPSWVNKGQKVNGGKMFGTYSYDTSVTGIDNASWYGNILNKAVNDSTNILINMHNWLTGPKSDYTLPNVEVTKTIVMAEYHYIPFTANPTLLEPVKGKKDGKGNPIINDFSPQLKYYLPLSSGENKDVDFFNGNTLIGTGTTAPSLSDRIGLRGNGYIFFGSYAGGNTEKYKQGDPTLGEWKKPDDGATTIEFITKGEYDSDLGTGEYPTYVEGLLDDLPYNSSDIGGTSVMDIRTKGSIPTDGLAKYSGIFAGKWKTHEIFNVKVENTYEGYDDGVIPSWVTFYQNTTTQKLIFTKFRATNSNGSINETDGDIVDPTTNGNVVKGITKLNGLIKGINTREHQNATYSKRDSDDYGETIDNLLGYKKGKSYSLPYLNFRMYTPQQTEIGWSDETNIQEQVDESNTQFSLFGSDLYHQQDIMGKAYLFLHSLPWNGMVHDFGAGFFGEISDKVNNLLNFYDKCGRAGDETDGGNQCNRGGGLFTHDIQHYFNQRAGFVEAPLLWIRFVGSILWRQKQQTDPIKWDNGKYSYLPLSDINSTIKSTPKQNQYCLPNTGTNEVIGFLSAPYDLKYKDFWSSDRAYVDIERPLDRLPEAMQNKFINEFLKFVEVRGDFEEIRKDYDMFLKTDTEGNYVRNAEGTLINVTEDERIRLWLLWNRRLEFGEGLSHPTYPNVVGGPNTMFGFDGKGTNKSNYIGDNNINPKLSLNYIIASRDDKYASYFYDQLDDNEKPIWGKENLLFKQLEAAGQQQTDALRVAAAKVAVESSKKGSPFNFFLEMRDGTNGQKNLYKHLVNTKVIVNSSWRLWASNAENPIDSPTVPFRFDPNKLLTYVKSWSTEYRRVSTENADLLDEEEEAIKRELFKSIDAL